MGLYRDDGLAVADKTPRQNDILKKKVCEVFRKVGLAITITANQNEVDFLDITINMKNETFKPFIKLNDKPEYVNKLSNHPPQILKNIPIGINKRLANISANKEIFENSTQVYSDALLQCGYEHQLSYEDFIHNNNTEKPKRRREISWFNPPFSKNVETRVGAKFLKIVDEKFPDNLRKHFNRNTVKLGYKCMPNIKNHIDRHNTSVMKTLDNNNNIRSERCNCQVSKKADCPLPGRCAVEDVVYKASVQRHDDQSVETYTGLTTSFKQRYSKHSSSFKYPAQRNKTTLSSHVWGLKDMNVPHTISWDIIARAPSFNPTTKICRLCLTEIYHIMWSKEGATLNKRDELFGYCRHRWKHLLIKPGT